MKECIVKAGRWVVENRVAIIDVAIEVLRKLK